MKEYKNLKFKLYLMTDQCPCAPLCYVLESAPSCKAIEDELGVKGDGPGDKVDPSDYIDHRAEERTALHFHRHVGGVSTRVHKCSQFK